MKFLMIALMIATVSACSTVPMDKTTLLAHAQRNCRVQAATSPAYAIDSTGGGTVNVAYQKCMAARGFLQ